MDYSQEMLRLHKNGPMGMEVYNISVNGGMITVESGLMGKRGNKVMHAMSEKPRVDRMIQQLLEKGFAPFEKTIGPWSTAKGQDQWRAQHNQARRKPKLGGFGYQ